jgi:predicted O-methyltransferase YrrM
MEEFPPLVARANTLARRAGLTPTRRQGGDASDPSCCQPCVGRLLAVLAAGCHDGRIGEIGTGVGLGSAWMASSMPADCMLVTVEMDKEKAAHATRLLADDGRVMVLNGDPRDLMPTCAPYDLLYADGGHHDRASFASLVDLLRVGGQLVTDDVTPPPALPPDSPSPARHVKRDFFFGDPRLVSTEIVLPDHRNSLLIGTRLA